MIAFLVGLAFAGDTDAIGPCIDVGTLWDDVTVPSGIRAYARGLGVSMNDLDADGDLDLYVATGPSTAEGAAYYSGRDLVYLNRGDLTFEEKAVEMGLGDLCEDRGPMFGDLGNDGIPDLYVTVNGNNVLYRGLGGGRYVDVSYESGEAAHPGWGHQGVLLDYDRDGFLDVFFTNGPEDGSGFNVLLRNQRDGTFREVTFEAGVQGDPSGKGACVLDVDRDGWLDLFVATGREFGNHLFVNQADGTFLDEAFERGVSDPLRRFGVGATCGDLDNDGDDDILLITHDRVFGGNALFENRDGVFSDIADVAGVGPFKDGHGSAMVDVDLDGLLDLVLSGIRTPPYVFINQGGLAFRRACDGAGLVQEDGLTWAVIAGDMTNDLYPEIYVANGLGRRPSDGRLYRHRGGDAHGLTIDTVDRHGRAAIGALVEVVVDGHTLTRRVGGWSTFDSQGPLFVTVGLADAKIADVRVTFPSGVVVDVPGVAADQSIVVEEPSVPDVDHDGVVDVWDVCAGTRSGARTDGEGCAPEQRGSFELTVMEPAQDAVVADAPTFRWSGGAHAVIQVGLSGSFGPADRRDFGPFDAANRGGEYRPSEAEWRGVVDENDGTRPLVWRVVAVGPHGEQATSDVRRLYAAKYADVVRVPTGANLFAPAHVAVPVGTTVTWWNDSVTGGSIQAEPHDVQLIDPAGRPVSDMKDLNTAGVFTWTFDQPGEWSYICHRHSGDGVPGDAIHETHSHLHRVGPYRCMSGTVTVR